jgi:hypothetical protein
MPDGPCCDPFGAQPLRGFVPASHHYRGSPRRRRSDRLLARVREVVMAYFPNGTSGMDYADQYCANCVHENEDGPYCPIWSLHVLHNYDQCGKGKTAKAWKEVLSSLIPETKDGLSAEQCTMFRAKADCEAEEAEQRRLAEQPIKYAEAMERRVA